MRELRKFSQTLVGEHLQLVQKHGLQTFDASKCSQTFVADTGVVEVQRLQACDKSPASEPKTDTSSS